MGGVSSSLQRHTHHALTTLVEYLRVGRAHWRDCVVLAYKLVSIHPFLPLRIPRKSTKMMDVGSGGVGVGVGVDGSQAAQYPPTGYAPMSSLQDFYSNTQHCSYSNPVNCKAARRVTCGRLPNVNTDATTQYVTTNTTTTTNTRIRLTTQYVTNTTTTTNTRIRLTTQYVTNNNTTTTTTTTTNTRIRRTTQFITNTNTTTTTTSTSHQQQTHSYKKHHTMQHQHDHYNNNINITTTTTTH
ncbi:hypothetical protein Pmani_039903 [Petrolisthes manimaculis]|uniref:Uncharacterized protein n=1 Tax=Petrolisthes manimaculis TaxID=1843537 RepID=A0AAE1TKV2_9EUCA|nr:hypothetical protein Pmani_039903 [Petrolisthes manimaculis]